MRKRYTEERIIGFLREAEARMPVSETMVEAILVMSTLQMEDEE